jgi:hypothetical protein
MTPLAPNSGRLERQEVRFEEGRLDHDVGIHARLPQMTAEACPQTSAAVSRR